MASFDAVNYSLRPSKAIQRQLVFDGLRRLQTRLALEQIVYVGFGSIWFTDFIMAHRLLGVDTMISIEADEVGHRRAVFNCPYATISVRYGLASDVLPGLYGTDDISGRPWIIWLDYDYEFDESLRDDINSVVENAPANSVLLVTFNGHEMKYGRVRERVQRIRHLFGDIVPDELSNRAVRDERTQQTLADFAMDYLKAVAGSSARLGGFIPAYRLIYRDSAPMITVGGFLPSRENVESVTQTVSDQTWPGMPALEIVAPHLTIKEASVLQSQLPSAVDLSRALVRTLGFDLEDQQIASFQRYYKQYPSFAQILT